jgi:PAS domain S-box-containing protein
MRNLKVGNGKGGAVALPIDPALLAADDQRAQDALAYAENIIATLREPFIVLDGSLRVQTANAAFLETFHVSAEETEGQLVYDLGSRQWDIPRLRTLLEEVLPQKQSFHDYEVAHDFTGIGEKVMLLNARRLESSPHRPELILLAIEDITERRRAETAMQRSEIQYRRLFETGKDGILILDASTGAIIDANPFMSTLLGYAHADFIGRQLWEIGLFSDKRANETAFQELQEHGYVRYDHLPLETNDGRRIEVEFVSNVYRVDQRHVAQCNIRDISERNRVERKMQAQADELSDLHRRKDEFLAMLSHELRNPLASMINAVELLRLQKLSENGIQQRSRSILERQLGDLKHLVDDLLEVSRITTGRIRLRQELVPLADIVEGAMETVRPIMDNRRHQFIVNLPSDAVWLRADPARIGQVLVNLLTNAAKFTDEGGRIWLTVRREPNACVLSVRDTGVGIAPELLPRIFDLFTQAERLPDRSQGGLGIGLCLVQRLVELHGGTVKAFSTLNEGSEFIVRLPTERTPTAQPAAPVSDAMHSTRRRVRVLVVDDDVDMAESTAIILRDAGHDVRTAYDGASALQAGLDYQPHAVLLDIGLPGMSGHEVARRMRQQPELKHVILVAVTGYGQERDSTVSREAGFNHHLVKPADYADIHLILDSIVPVEA